MERTTLRPLPRRISAAALLGIRYPHRLVVVCDLVSVDGDRVDIFKTVCGRRNKSVRAQLPATKTTRTQYPQNHTQPALYPPPSTLSPTNQPTIPLPLLCQFLFPISSQTPKKRKLKPTPQPQPLQRPNPPGLQQLPNNAIRLLEALLQQNDAPSLLPERDSRRTSHDARADDHNVRFVVDAAADFAVVLGGCRGGGGHGGGG